MNKQFSQKIYIGLALTILGIGMFLASPVFAQDNNLVVEFEKTPLFDEANFLPGQGVTRWVRVINNSGQPQRIAAEAINYPGFISGSPRPHPIPHGDLSRALSVIIREKGVGDLYGGSIVAKTLYDFYQNGETYLSYLPTGETKEYEFEIIFPPEKENEWQSKTTNFDILIGFQGVAGKVPPGEGGGGTGLPPGLTIQYERDMWVGTTTAKISWLTSYKSTSRVIYDTVSGVFDLNILPNYGYSFSTPEYNTPANTYGVTYHEVTLTGLTSGTTYYYRCVSHGSLAISTEYSFTTLGVKVEEKVEEGIEEEIEEGVPVEEIILTPGGIIRPGVQGEKGEESGEIEKPALVEKEEKALPGRTGIGKFLAAIGAFPFNLKVILVIVALILTALIILWLFKKKKERK